ncbi:hypothetical protein F511_47212 [Dorcoceras hygrometricum]|uniref:Uncharacterized protein n=1 Tax=Dorcoceras hygrometricum TaxID=472368 RepID=A0A2Z6ZY76_9LAMI|nr:hypothetical protein F511_47212 [Dorcoceras hygrometricum]
MRHAYISSADSNSTSSELQHNLLCHDRCTMAHESVVLVAAARGARPRAIFLVAPPPAGSRSGEASAMS